MKNVTFALSLLWVIILSALAGGWVANIFKIVGTVDGGVTVLLTLRVIGVFALPLGGVLGWV